MAKIANVALTNTFDYWRLRSNEAFDRLSQFAVNNSRLYANTVIANNVLKSLGNTVVGVAGKRAIVNGLLSANGRVTITTNLDVTGNTSSNKLTVSSSLRSTGNNVLGAAGKTAVVNGILNANGRVTIATNATVSGNVSTNKIVVTSSLTSSGNSIISGLIANNSLGSANYVLKTNGTTVFWAPVASSGQSNVFSAIAVSGQDTLYADGANDTLNLAAGYGIAITTTNTTDTATIRATNTLAANAYVQSVFAPKNNPITSGLHTHTGRAIVNTSFLVSGNTVLGGSGKKLVVNGLHQANGRIAVTNNVDVTGNTSSNKVFVTNHLRSSGNTFIGATGKTSVVNGILSANGRITVSTNLSVTGNTSSNKLSVTSNIDGTNANTRVLALGVGTAAGSNGSIRATNDITAYYSDERLKINIGMIDDALTKVLSLDGFYFRPNDVAKSFGYEDKIDVGVSAQQVQNILPEIVVPAPIDEKYFTVKYEKLIPLLIEAIKVLSKRVEELEKNK